MEPTTTEPSYTDRITILILISLDDTRILQCFMFAFEVLVGQIDAPYIILKKQGPPSRTNETFVVPFRRTNYAKFLPFIIMVRMFNEMLRTTEWDLCHWTEEYK